MLYGKSLLAPKKRLQSQSGQQGHISNYLQTCLEDLGDLLWIYGQLELEAAKQSYYRRAAFYPQPFNTVIPVNTDHPGNTRIISKQYCIRLDEHPNSLAGELKCVRLPEKFGFQGIYSKGNFFTGESSVIPSPPCQC